jgi:hypothetical protein
VWFYSKTKGRSLKTNKEIKIFMLNLVEVTVPWGKVNADFEQTEFPDIKTEDSNALVRARNRKNEKYRRIE